MKRCKRCQTEKEIGEFTRNVKMADGHLNICKACNYARTQTPEFKEKRRLYKQRHKERDPVAYRAARRRSVKASNLRNFERHHARMRLEAAVQRGRIKRWPVCAVPDCCNAKPEAHHADYSRPFDVVWLCREHHLEAHAIAKEKP